MDNPIVLSRPGCVTDNSLHVKDKMEMCGNNTGNNLFMSAIRNILSSYVDNHSIKLDLKMPDKSVDGVIIPAANWLSSSSNYRNLAVLLEKANLPVAVVGLGAQAYGGGFPSLTEGTIKFLNVVSHLSNSISVRGNFTAELLNYHGIKNVAVTGCPSLLWHVNKLPHVDKSISLNDQFKIVINGTRGESPNLFKNKRFLCGLLLARLGIKYNWDYVAQTEFTDVQLASGETISQQQECFLKNIYEENDFDKVNKYIQNHIKCFYDVNKWIDYIGRQDFNFGSRLHGIIVGILAGTPGLLIVHDSRTKEMAEFMKIPHIEFDKFQKIHMDKNIISELWDMVDYKEFNSNLILYKDNFKSFFDSCGIKTLL